MSIIISEDDKYLICKRREEEEQFEIKGKIEDEGGRYVEMESETYYLIERNEQIVERMQTCDFSYCLFFIEVKLNERIFEKNANFIFSTFKEKVDFSKVIFKEKVDFTITTFEKEANFGSVKFEKEADFFYVRFEKEANFDESTFKERVNFQNVIFTENVNFNKALFEKETSFMNVIFKGNANFKGVYFDYDMIYEDYYIGGAVFKERVTFESASFEKSANFESAKFEKEADFGRTTFKQRADFSGAIFKGVFDFTSINEQKGFILDLKLAQIEGMDYTDANINKAKNRETFLILKSLAIKNNDQVKALEFHTKEMEQYKEELKDEKSKWSDRLILSFEERASYFGTAPLRAMGWIVGIHLAFVILLLFLLNDGTSFEISSLNQSIIYFVYSLNPTYLLDKILGDDIHGLGQGTRAILEVVNLFKNILTAILIYETIKSFRKYSRKL